MAIEGVATETAAGNPDLALTGMLTGNNIRVHGCTSNFRTFGPGTSANYAERWFRSQSGNEVLTTSPLMAGSFLPNGVAPVGVFPPAGAAAPGLNDWFMANDFVGAFRSNLPEDNWTLGWTRPFNP